MLWLLDVVAALMEVTLGALLVAVHINNPFNGLIATMAAALWTLAAVLLGLLALKLLARPIAQGWSQLVLICQIMAFGFFVICGIVVNATTLTAWRIDHLHYNKIFLVFFTLIVVIVGYTTLPLPGYMLGSSSSSSSSNNDRSLAPTNDKPRDNTDLEKHPRVHLLASFLNPNSNNPNLRQPVPKPLPPTNNPLGDEYEAPEPGFDMYPARDRRHASRDSDYDRYNSLFDLGVPAHSLPTQQPRPTNLAGLPMLPHNWSLPLSNTSPMLLHPSSALSHLPIRKMLLLGSKHGHLNLVLTLKGYLTGKTKHHKKLSLVPTTHSYNLFGSSLGLITAKKTGNHHHHHPLVPMPPPTLAPPLGLSYHHMIHSDSITSRGTALASDLIEFWDDDQLPLPLSSHLPVPLELQWAPGGNDLLRILLVPSQVIGEYDKEKWDTLKALHGAVNLRLGLKPLRLVDTNGSRNST